jgi:hypothetical protein
VIATGKFYCSDDCRNAAYYHFYFAIAILCLISLPTSIIVYFQSPVGELRDFMMWVFYMSIIGAIGGIAYTWESKRIRMRVSKNSKSLKTSELE